MSPNEYSTYVSIFLSLLLLAYALKIWRRFVITWTRESAFSIRADLFDCARENDAFSDPAYRETRLVINGMLRWLEQMSVFNILCLSIQMKLRNLKFDTQIEGLEDSPIKTKIIDAQESLKKLIMRHFCLVGFDGILLMGIVAFIGGMASTLRAAYCESEKYGKSEEYATRKSKEGPWHPDRNQKSSLCAST